MKTYQNIFKPLLFTLFLGMAFSSCSSDDDGSSPNQAPNSFNLVSVADGADLQPQLSWETATDPEGDNVSYQVYFDTQNPPQNSIANGIAVSTFSVQNELQPETTYYWKVIAKDANGNTTQSNIDSFKTREMTTGEAIIGKWFFESQTEQPPFSECQKSSFINFTDDLFLQINRYDDDATGNCVPVSSQNGIYEVIGMYQIKVTVVSTIEEWNIQSLTQTELVIATDDFMITFRKD